MTGKIIQSGSGASSRGLNILPKRNNLLLELNPGPLGPLVPHSLGPCLVHLPARKTLVLRLQAERAKGLFVLRNVLAQHVP